MRAALSTIQQTLTPEAASVLNHSIAEAGRRNHGQTTPLHVAATLLASPSGFLRQACIRSHPNSSHPLQCRALELCFSVALDRLSTAQTAAPEPPISNALLAALKRAQANQRRGCPEQQQQPLLAVKVELEQLIVSILDDPSVSRVMREASFSSPAVKATIEQSLNASAAPPRHIAGGNPNFGTIGGRMIRNLSPPVQNSSPLLNRNIYLNPRLQQGAAAHIGNPKGEEVKRVLEIMARTKKRNPILVGDSEPEVMVKEFLTKMQNKELGNDGILKNVRVISIEKGLLSDKSQIAEKIDELGELIRTRMRSGGVILDLGDLKWLVEHPVSFGESQQKQQLVSELGRVAVAEMAKLVAQFDGGDGASKLWLLGTATCETYLRCQVYHSTIENDWDLQAVPVTSQLPIPGSFPRLGADRLLGGPLDTLNSLKAVPPPLPALVRHMSETLDPFQNTTLCPQCSENHEKEVAKLASFTHAKQELNRSTMPRWLQSAKLNNTDPKATDEDRGKDQGVLSKQKTQELQKKWRDTCLHLHPNFHQNNGSDRACPPAVSMPSLYNPNLLLRSTFQPKPQMVKPLGEALKLNMTPVTTSQLAHSANGPPGSPVRTDLVLGRKEHDSVLEKITENQAKDFLGCISSEPTTKLLEKFSNALDADTYKKLLKGLMEKSWWQAEAASAVALAITRCRLGNGKRRAGSRGDIWLLFTGPDRVGKKKMGSVLAEQICRSNPIMICLGKRRDAEEVDMNFRGKTAIDRIAEAVRRNPFSVIMLEDIDEADILVRGSIKQAVERGRLTDSHGREVRLGNGIFIVTGDWSTTNPEALGDGRFVDNKKLASTASGGWQLGLSVREKSAKRRANWLHNDDDRPLKPRKEMALSLSLDLNLAAACTDDGRPDGSHISSDLTLEDELGLVSQYFSVTSVPHDLVSNVDDSIAFKPVDSSFVRHEIRKTIAVKFSMAVDENLSIEIEDDVLEKILGGVWHDQTSLQEWVEKVLTPSFDQLKAQLPTGDRSNLVARLVVESNTSHGNADWLPSSIML